MTVTRPEGAVAALRSFSWYRRVRQGFDERTVVVRALSEERRGAPEAAQLYEETPESIAARGAEAERRRLDRAGMQAPQRRPDKRERRQIHRFREDMDR